jgi:hypothetical protein
MQKSQIKRRFTNTIKTIIHKSLEENGSPPPVFETDENNTYFLCVLSVHPLTNSILGSQDDLRRDEDKIFIFK